ncbi:MAG: nucleoside hydrolase, partial [Pseudomonadota bacterium]
MAPRKIIIDTDPGQDDAVAILRGAMGVLSLRAHRGLSGTPC